MRQAKSKYGRKYNLAPSKTDKRDYKLNTPRHILKNLQDKVDVLDTMRMPIYDQGSLGSCSANAIGYHYQFCRWKQGLISWVPSRLFTYWNERYLAGTINEDSGASLRDGMKTICADGMVPETEWPYDIDMFTSRAPSHVYIQALSHQVEMYQNVHPTVEQVFGCLAQGFPFICGIQVFQSFESEETKHTGVIKMPHMGWSKWRFGGEPSLGWHAICIHKYDAVKQEFGLLNSYGSEWGMMGKGVIPVKYLVSEDLCCDRWTIRLLEKET